MKLCKRAYQTLHIYSLGQADLLRRAMCKVDDKELTYRKGLFLDGAQRNGVDPKKAESILDIMSASIIKKGLAPC